MQYPSSIRNLLSRIQYPGLVFESGADRAAVDRLPSLLPWLRVGDPDGTCNVTSAALPWWGRKWRLSYHMTDGEVVATAFKALLTALEHEARERFTFDGQAVYDSHVDVHKLVQLRAQGDSLVGRAHGPAPECVHRWEPKASPIGPWWRCGLCEAYSSDPTPSP